MKKCSKTTSGEHYWHSTPKERFNLKGERGLWLDGEIFVKAIRKCLACGLIDDLKQR